MVFGGVEGGELGASVSPPTPRAPALQGRRGRAGRFSGLKREGRRLRHVSRFPLPALGGRKPTRAGGIHPDLRHVAGRPLVASVGGRRERLRARRAPRHGRRQPRPLGPARPALTFTTTTTTPAWRPAGAERGRRRHAAEPLVGGGGGGGGGGRRLPGAVRVPRPSGGLQRAAALLGAARAAVGHGQPQLGPQPHRQHPAGLPGLLRRAARARPEEQLVGRPARRPLPGRPPPGPPRPQLQQLQPRGRRHVPGGRRLGAPRPQPQPGFTPRAPAGFPGSGSAAGPRPQLRRLGRPQLGGPRRVAGSGQLADRRQPLGVRLHHGALPQVAEEPRPTLQLRFTAGRVPGTTRSGRRPALLLDGGELQGLPPHLDAGRLSLHRLRGLRGLHRLGGHQLPAGHHGQLLPPLEQSQRGRGDLGTDGAGRSHRCLRRGSLGDRSAPARPPCPSLPSRAAPSPCSLLSPPQTPSPKKQSLAPLTPAETRQRS